MLRKTQQLIFGIDEVGRGPLAGPVLACSLVILKNYEALDQKYGHLPDSKGLSANKREQLFMEFKMDQNLRWGIGRVGQNVIDRLNIFEAAKLAMVRAAQNLEKNLQRQASLLLLDGNFNIPINRPQQAIIKGDTTVLPIKLASIVAKVTRDRLMIKYHQKYPRYGFDRHKGYGTKAHYQALSKYGPCPLHRQCFNLKKY